MLVPLTQTSRSSFCEWKGRATYYSITAPSQDNNNNGVNTDNALGKGSLLHWNGTNQYTSLSLSLDNSLSPALP